MFFSGSKHFLKADHTDEILRLPWPKKTVLWHIQPSWPWSTSAEKNTRFLPSTWGLDTHRHSKTGFRNLRGQLCMIQGFALNGSPGKVLYRIVCWFVGHSSGGCYSDCFHFLSVAAHIKDFVLVSIIVTNWILHFPRTRVTNLQQSECMSVHVHLCVHVCVSQSMKEDKLTLDLLHKWKIKCTFFFLTWSFLWIRKERTNNTSTKMNVERCNEVQGRLKGLIRDKN